MHLADIQRFPANLYTRDICARSERAAWNDKDKEVPTDGQRVGQRSRQRYAITEKRHGRGGACTIDAGDCASVYRTSFCLPPHPHRDPAVSGASSRVPRVKACPCLTPHPRRLQQRHFANGNILHEHTLPHKDASIAYVRNGRNLIHLLNTLSKSEAQTHASPSPPPPLSHNLSVGPPSNFLFRTRSLNMIEVGRFECSARGDVTGTFSGTVVGGITTFIEHYLAHVLQVPNRVFRTLFMHMCSTSEATTQHRTSHTTHSTLTT